MSWDLVITYQLRILPALLAVIVSLLVIPRKATILRICCYIMLFIAVRDTMTPEGLWRLDTRPIFWIRFIDNGGMLVLLGLSSAAIACLIYFFERDMRRLIVWKSGNPLASFAAGFAGAAMIVLPLLLAYRSVPVAQRGGAVGYDLLIPLLVVTMGGNLLEEFLFRGCLQGYFEQELGLAPIRAAFLSGVFFAQGHVFLACSVTNVGWPILAFTLYEGIIAGLVRMKFGVLSSTLAHGAAIFLISSGLP